MLVPFDKSANIFDISPFIKDEIAFNMIHRIRDSENPILLKRIDSKILVAQSSSQHPVWIWTDDDISDQGIEELAYEFYNLYADKSQLSIVAKPMIAEYLAENYSKQKNIHWKIRLSLGAYHCPKVIVPKNSDGEIGRALIDDISTIASFLVGFVQDCFSIETTLDEHLETAKAYIESDNFYVWKKGNEIVSMANIAHRSSRHARINEVYTSPNYRGKGYAGALVSTLCKMIQSENKTPMLYTDLSNPASNRAYKKVGFIESGRVSEISFDFNQI